MPHNILFLMADQMHAFAMGCMGNHDIKTPNLDRLAARGTLFRTCYSSNPVCSPWRAALFSGRYSCQTGMIGINDLPMPPGERCLADSLNDAGYATSYVGKWHVGGSGNVWVPPGYRCGFTHFTGSQCVNEFHFDVFFYDEEGQQRDIKKHRTNATVDMAIERLAPIRHEPFAMFVSFSNPHYPVQPDPEYAALYEDATLTMRPNYVEGVDPYTTPWTPMWEGDPEQHPYKLALGGSMERYIKLYYGMVSQLDAQIGRLIEQLEAWGLYDQTMIVFTSDHGDMQGSHGLVNKHVPYEESTRCPLIMRVPGQQGGHVVETPVDTVDFLPTLLEAAGTMPSALAEGKSLLPQAMGGREPHKEWVFVENGWPQGANSYYMIRCGRHKLVTDTTYAARHLFDLLEDPYELTDRVDDPTFSERRDELVAMLRQHHQELLSRANPLCYHAGDTRLWHNRLETQPPLLDQQRYSPAFIADFLAATRT